MKSICIFMLFLSFAQSHAAQIAIIGGHANTQLEFVKNMVSDTVIVDENTDRELTTQWLSILSRAKIDSVALVVSEAKLWNYDKIAPVLQEASQYSKVVLAPITAQDGFLCLQMKKQTDTVFVLPAGDDGADLNVPGVGVKWCQAPNLIFVGPLKAYSSYIHWGNYGTDYVRVAAPGHNIRVIKANGQTGILTSSLASAAIVAAQVAHFSEKFPILTGYQLAHRFIESKTQTNSQLNPYVKGGRVIFKNSYINNWGLSSISL